MLRLAACTVVIQCLPVPGPCGYWRLTSVLSLEVLELKAFKLHLAGLCSLLSRPFAFQMAISGFMTLHQTMWASSSATGEGCTGPRVTRVFSSLWHRCFHFLEPFGLCLLYNLCPFSLFAPLFLLTARVLDWAGGHPGMLWLCSPFTVRALWAGSSSLWSREELRLQLGSWCSQVLVFLERHPTLMLRFQQIFHML